MPPEMNEALKWIAGGGSFGTLLAIFYIWKIAPRLHSLELTILRQQRIKLLDLAARVAQYPTLHAEAMEMLQEVDDATKGNNVSVQ